MSRSLRSSKPDAGSSSSSGLRPSVRQLEERRQQRTLLLIEVWFHTEGEEPVWGVSRDLSLGGVFVETTAPAPFGAKVVLMLKVPGLPEPMRIDGVVRWTSHQGMGVQFGLMGARETHALTRLIADGV